MKKLLFCLLILAGAGIFQSCQKDDVISEAVANKSLTINATLPDNAGTKVILGETTGATTKVYWEEGDVITLTTGNGVHEFTISNYVTNSTTAQFTCASIESLEEGTYTFTYGNVPAKLQKGTKEDLSNHHFMEATVTISAEGDPINLNFNTKVSIVEITLPEGITPQWVWLYDETSGECLAYKNEGTSSNQFHFAVEPGAYKGIVYYQIGNDLYQFNIGTVSNVLSEGNLYRVNVNSAGKIGAGECVEISTGKIYYTKPDNNTIYLYGGITLEQNNSIDYDIENVIILEGVTTIGTDAFFGCSSLSSIKLPTSVNVISVNAFYGCTSLSSITLPTSVNVISDNAFFGCTSLSSITLPTSVNVISDNAFFGCTSLSSIAIPNGVTEIGNSAFYNCLKLSNITIPESVTTIGPYAFSVCKLLSSITIPANVTTIGSSAFYACEILQSVICNRITPPTLGNYAFDACHQSLKIIVPSSSVEAYSSATNWDTYADKIEASTGQ